MVYYPEVHFTFLGGAETVRRELNDFDFPQVAFGGGYSTTFVLNITGLSPINSSLNFTQGVLINGSPIVHSPE